MVQDTINLAIIYIATNQKLTVGTTNELQKQKSVIAVLGQDEKFSFNRIQMRNYLILTIDNLFHKIIYRETFDRTPTTMSSVKHI